METQMTSQTQTSRKIIEAIQECDRFIAKEEPRRNDLRPADVAKTLAFYKQHRLKLAAMLGAGQ